MVIWVQTWEYTVILYKASSYPENTIYIKKLLFKDFILKIYTANAIMNSQPLLFPENIVMIFHKFFLILYMVMLITDFACLCLDYIIIYTVYMYVFTECTVYIQYSERASNITLQKLTFVIKKMYNCIFILTYLKEIKVTTLIAHKDLNFVNTYIDPTWLG